MSICIALTNDREGTDPAVAPSAAAAAVVGAVGGKARSLLRLAEAGLPVPAAFAVTDALFRRLRAAGPRLPSTLRSAADLTALDHARDVLLATPWPPGSASEIGRHLHQLARGDAGARFSVRSSFLREDRAAEPGATAGSRAGAGAGVYDSIIGVARNDVPSAIARVLASALSPGAVAYARARGEDPEDQATAVLIHRTIVGEASGSGAFDPHGDEPPAIEAATGTLDPGAREALARALRDLAARHGAVEVEWVSAAGQLTFLQLRPYVAPPKAHAWTPGRALGDGDWHWDAAHNPLPLSPAQAGLVAIADASCRIGIRQRVVGGYLFYAKDGPAPLGTIEPEEMGGAFAALGADVVTGLAALGEPPALEEALALFVSFYDRLFGAIQPALRRARRALDAFLRAHAPDDVARLPELLAGVHSLATERRRRAQGLARARSQKARAVALSAYLARFGDEAPVWDVAVPTYREDPVRLLAPGRDEPGSADGGQRHNDAHNAARGDARQDSHQVGQGHDLRDHGAGADDDGEPMPAGEEAPAPDGRAAAHEITARLPAAVADAFGPLLAQARLATAIGEDDDALYARTQVAVRAALRGEGARLTRTGSLAGPDEIFWLPLDLVRRLARGEAPPDRATIASMVADAWEAHQESLHDPPPSGGPERGQRHNLAGGPGRGPGAVIPGRRASGGRIIGPAFIHRSAGQPSAPTRASIVVAATLLPTELPLLQAAGLVVESGGILGHVAAQARERGIPALVDAHGACDTISDGDLLLLDADAGQVVRLT